MSMHRLIWSAVAGLAVAAATSAALADGGGQASDPGDLVERGSYLVTVGGCDDCHTPKKMGETGPEPDFSRRLIGHPEEEALPPAPALEPGPWAALGSWDLTAWNGPWGTSFAMNLTPDENTGIGIWSEEMFVRAIRTGRHMGQSRPILPPMPWQNYAKMTDDDLKAIFAFLRSLPPVHNRIPEPLPPPSDEQAEAGF